MAERKFKERNNQYQSSRLFLRAKDHRDLIYSDIYQNAIAYYKEQDDKNVDVVKWHKYKPHTLLGSLNGYLTSIDADNQYVHTTENLRENVRIINLQDYIVAYMIENSAFVERVLYISKNGCDWYQTQLSNKKTYRFVPYGTGNKFVASIESGTSGLSLYEYEVEEDAETKQLSIRENGVIAAHWLMDRWFDYTLGKTSNGCLIAAGGYSNWRFYECRDGDYVELLNITRQYSDYFDSYNRFSVYGNGKAVVGFVYGGQTASQSTIQIKVLVVENGSAYVAEVDELVGTYNSQSTAIVEFKNNTWVLYVRQYISSTDWKIAMYTSADAYTWEAVALPDYIDVPVFDTTFRSRYYVETLRIKFDTNTHVDIPENGRVVMPMPYKDTSVGMAFCNATTDGKWSDIVPNVCIPCQDNFYAVFDNLLFQANENCFAFGTDSWNPYPEELRQGDYCF